MTVLADLLGRRVPAGAYRWPAAPPSYDAARVARVADRVGWSHARLGGADLDGRAGLVRALADALDLSGLHGRNLDALEERVRVQPRRGPLLLVWEDWAGFAVEHPRAARGALAVVTAPTQAPTWVLLLHDGPEVGAAVLGGPATG